MFFGDPLYLILMLVGMVLVYVPQSWVKSTVDQFLQERTSRGTSGRDVARSILNANGLHDVPVELTEGFLSDHYDPSQRVVRLSPDIYNGSSIASVAVAAHECGHALQHAQGYVPVVMRSAMAPVVGFGSNLGPWMIIIALGLGASSQIMPDWAWYLAWVGVILYGLAVLFHLVTLPVEIDASGRALQILETNHYLTSAELPGAKKVLTAAALTYVAAALYALMQLLYFVFRLLSSSRRD